MRLDTEQRTFETNIDAAPSSFKIQATAKAFQILSSGLYSNKALAIVRELTANAIDAHVAAGTTDVPFKIHLPTQLEPWFEIKDYGTGLSDEGIRGLYTTYFASNKTDTDELIGGFGLGSKSPFAYTDQFTVTSRHGGMERAYSISISADGMPQIMKVSEVPTDEAPGLTVNIGVAMKDCGDFLDAAGLVLPFVENCAFEANADVQKQEYIFELPLPEIGAVARMRKDSYDRPHINVVQGCVRYSTNKNDCPELNGWLGCVDVYVPIGTLDVAVSREQIAYTERVRKWFAEGAKLIMKAANKKLEQDLAGFDNLIDRAKYLLQLSHYRSPMAAFIQAEHFDEIAPPIGLDLYQVKWNWRRGNYRCELKDLNVGAYKSTRAFSRMLIELVARCACAAERKTWVKPHLNALGGSHDATALVLVGPIKLAEQFYTSLGVDWEDVKVAPKPAKKPRAATSSLAGTYHCAAITSRTWSRQSLADLVSHELIFLVDREVYDNRDMWRYMEALNHFGLLNTDADIILIDVPVSHKKVRKELIEEYDAEVLDFNCTMTDALKLAVDKFELDKQAIKDRLIELAPTDATLRSINEHGMQNLTLTGNTALELVFKKYAPDFLALLVQMKQFTAKAYDHRHYKDTLTGFMRLLDEQDKADVDQAMSIDLFRTQIDAVAIKYGAWVWSIPSAADYGANKDLAAVAEAALMIRHQLQEQLKCNTPISSLEMPSLSTLAA